MLTQLLVQRRAIGPFGYGIDMFTHVGSVARACLYGPDAICELVDVPLPLALNASSEDAMREVESRVTAASMRVRERVWLRTVLEGAD